MEVEFETVFSRLANREFILCRIMTNGKKFFGMHTNKENSFKSALEDASQWFIQNNMDCSKLNIGIRD